MWSSSYVTCSSAFFFFIWERGISYYKLPKPSEQVAYMCLWPDILIDRVDQNDKGSEGDKPVVASLVGLSVRFLYRK